MLCASTFMNRMPLFLASSMVLFSLKKGVVGSCDDNRSKYKNINLTHQHD